MKPSRSALCCLGLMLLLNQAAAQAQNTATTDPVGFMTLNIAPGNGSTTRALTLVSAPLLTSATKADGGRSHHRGHLLTDHQHPHQHGRRLDDR